jgi:hypothetical protein
MSNHHAEHAAHVAHPGHHPAHHPGHHPAKPAAPPAGDVRETYVPTNKTIGATVGSAVGGIIVYFVNRAWPGTITPEVAGMFTTVATFAVGYLVPPGQRETMVSTARGRRTAAT